MHVVIFFLTKNASSNLKGDLHLKTKIKSRLIYRDRGEYMLEKSA